MSTNEKGGLSMMLGSILLTQSGIASIEVGLVFFVVGLFRFMFIGKND